MDNEKKWRCSMEKKIYITKEEQEKCRKVADAFAELYELENILVIDAGRYGFVKLQYYKPPQGFEDAITFTLWQREHQRRVTWFMMKCSNLCQRKSRRSLLTKN